MDISLIVDILHTATLSYLVFLLLSMKKKQKQIVDRVNLIAKNPLKARKSTFKL